MKFKFILIFIFFLSCSPNSSLTNQKKTYTSKGFAFIYNDLDSINKIIKGKMDNEIMQISHQNLKTGALIKIINPKNKKSIVLKNIKRIKYPDFYKILITKVVADKLELNIDLPMIELIEVKKNKSFVAEKAIIYSEERKIYSKAPVASVEISNISKNKSQKIKVLEEKIYIHVATLYSVDTAEFLRKRIIKEIPEFKNKNLKIKNINNEETMVILGPYTSVNLLKNDYIKLIKFGFEELDVFINE